ncbi:MAG: PEF-CTERM sorting domain-containing protein, partial [Halanaerobiales bacterium]|nr:PEF-CTERM sorting domain-containing protein [Halanaerobiales bacterium]
SHVSYSTFSGQGNSSSTGVLAIDISILLNGLDASTFPGPVLIKGSEITVSYEISNIGDFRLVDVLVIDDEFGNVGAYDSLDVGESITFKLEEIVREGNFSSVGKVSARRESSLNVCNDQSTFYYFGKTGPEEIPEFPTFFAPILVILGLAFMFQRKRM